MADERWTEAERVFLQGWRAACAVELEASCLVCEASAAFIKEALELRQMAVELELLSFRIEVRAQELIRRMQDRDLLIDRRRHFSAAEKAQMFEAAEGRCQECGVDLERGWHADHYHPYSRGGPTRLSNARALCPTCNLRKHDRIPEGG